MTKQKTKCLKSFNILLTLAEEVPPQLCLHHHRPHQNEASAGPWRTKIPCSNSQNLDQKSLGFVRATSPPYASPPLLLTSCSTDNWSPNPVPDCSSLHFIPMQWNAVGIDDLPGKCRDVAIAFNEPELPDQSNMSAELAAEEWVRVFEPLRKRGVRCGSPGISCAGWAV